jgi:uncharacterized protein with PIN domain
VNAYRTADVRFYIDADLLGLAKILASVRYDVTYPGDPGDRLYRRQRPPCLITNPATLDHDWLPTVAAQGWVVITRDRRIQGHRAEIAAVREHGARLITLSSADAVSKFAQLEIVMCRWRDIEGCTREPGPFIYQTTRTAFTKLNIM